MHSKRAYHIICLVFLFLFIIIPPLQAAPRWYRDFRITITPQMPTSYQGTDAEFQADPTYIQGEQASFNITFTYERRWWWISFRLPVYIPAECIRATFPDLDTGVTLNHLFWGFYTYTSPVLTEVGSNNHTLGIVVYYILRFNILGQTLTFHLPMGIAQKSISVAARPVDIEITSPTEGAVVNTNPLNVEGTVDDNSATVTVNGVLAIVSDNQFSAEVNLEEGLNTIIAVAVNEYGNTDSDSITIFRQQSQSLVEVIGRQLFVNDEPYIIRGVTYQPTPIGMWPGNPYFIYTSQNCDRDFSLLRDMGSNTIRTYSIVNQTLLDKAQEYGIKVAAGFWVDYELNLSDPTIRNELITSFSDYVEEFKDHLALLIWVIGNEQNNQNGDNPDWYSLANEMAGAARSIEGEGYHPVAISNGDLGNIGNPDMLADDDSLNNIDIWGVNVYIGYSFADYFSQYAGLSNRPLWISECGIDAYDNVHNMESQKRQAAWDTHSWEEIYQSDVCIGATLMSYSDEWWKAENGSEYIHEIDGVSTNNWTQPDGFLNEEWWGIVAVSDNGVNPDIVIPRMAYFSLKKRWAGQAEPVILQDNLPGGTFSNNGTCSYSYDDVGQFLSITYDVNNIDSYSGYYATLNGFDSRPYNSVSLSVRGQNGGEQFKLGLRDQDGNEAKINVWEYLTSGVTDSWQDVIIPLTSFGSNVDIGRLGNISITFEYAIASGSGTIYIDNIGFREDLPPLTQSGLGLTPWTHQVGDSQISYELNSDLAISYTVSGGTYCRVGMGLNRIDVSPYRNLSFSVRGAQSGERFHVYLEDFWNNRAYVEVNDITTEWQTVLIPLDPFIFQGVDITNLLNLEIVFEWEDRSGTVYLDDIQFANP